MAGKTFDELRQEVESLKFDNDSIKQTIVAFENRITHLEKEAASRSAPIRTVQHVVVQSKSSLPTSTLSETNQKQDVGAWFKPTPANKSTPGEESFEIQLGSVWLNRIGLGALLIGIVSLLLYSFQFFGPAAKIASGLIFGAVLATGSRFVLQKKSTPGSSRAWFFQGFNVLGWSVFYFSAYAMYFVPELKIIDSAGVEFVVLLATAIGVMGDAIVFNSETTAILATTFATASIGLCSTAANPFVALAIIMCSLAFFAVKRGWYLLLCSGTVVYYLTLAILMYPAQGASVWPIDSLVFQLPTLAAWICINTAIYMSRQTSKHRWAILFTALINAWQYGSVLIGRADAFPANTEYLSAMLGVLGTCYLGTAWFFEQDKARDLRNLFLFAAVTMLNISIWKMSLGQSEMILELGEVLMLTWVGIKYDVMPFRIMSPLVALFSLRVYNENLTFNLIALAAYCTAYVLSSRKEYLEKANRIEHLFLRATFYSLANAWIAICGDKGLDNDFKAPLLVLQALGNVAYSTYVQSRMVAYITGIYFFASSILVAVVIPESKLTTLIPSLAILYAGAVYCSQRAHSTDSQRPRIFKYAYEFTANGLTGIAITQRATPNTISAGLGLQGLYALTAGFLQREKSMRYIGLAIFGAVAIRLLFIDFASAPTIARIISFLLAGAIFVGTSFVYGWFSKKLTEEI